MSQKESVAAEIKRPLALIAVPIAALALSVGVGFAGVSLAQGVTGTSNEMYGPMHAKRVAFLGEKPAVVGIVQAINGTTLTVKSDMPDASDTITVDAANAKVTTMGENGPVAGGLADVAVGDHLVVRGTVSGSTVTANEIMEGMPGKGMFTVAFAGAAGMHMGGGVMGTISSVNGSTITVRSPDGKTYTVNAESAEVMKTIKIEASALTVGEQIGVHGKVDGTTVTADHIMAGVPQIKAGAVRAFKMDKIHNAIEIQAQ